MSKITSVKIIDVNNPEGTVKVMWNDDPDMVEEFLLPYDPQTKVAYFDDRVLRDMIRRSYTKVQKILAHKQSGPPAPPPIPSFNAVNSIKDNVYDLTTLVQEYEDSL